MGFNPKLRLFEYPDEKMKKAGEDALALVGLSGKKDDNYMTLSEGQKQLCIIARTLVSGAKLLLLDEPESALDFKLRYKTFLLLKRNPHSNRSPIISQQNRFVKAFLKFCWNLFAMPSIAGKARGRIVRFAI